MTAQTPGSVRIRSATLKGEDISGNIRDFKVWSSIFKPYRVAEVVLFDSQNLINRMKIQGNEDFEISFDTGGNNSGQPYRAKLKVTTSGNITDFPSVKAQGYRLRLADEMYFKNQTAKVSQAFSDVTGTDMIQKIFDQHLKPQNGGKLNIIKPSKGKIGTKYQKFIRANEYPLASISSILKILYANESGNYVFFQDDSGDYHCGPLAEIIKNAEMTEKFTRDPTVGSDSSAFDKVGKNIFGLYIPEKHSPAMDYKNTKNVIPDSVHKFGEKYEPGKKKNIQTDSVIGRPMNEENDNYQSEYHRNLINTAWDGKLYKNHPHYQTMGQRYLYSSILENGPSYSMSVFGDYGINVTVGKAVEADITEPSGDQNRSSQNQLKGKAIVANSMKHIKPYDTSPQFECTFDCFRGGVEKT
jgi:hypothetical protein